MRLMRKIEANKCFKNPYSDYNPDTDTELRTTVLTQQQHNNKIKCDIIQVIYLYRKVKII